MKHILQACTKQYTRGMACVMMTTTFAGHLSWTLMDRIKILDKLDSASRVSAMEAIGFLIDSDYAKLASHSKSQT